MKKNFAILLTIVLVASLSLMACSDDKNVCEEFADIYASALNEVCAEFPDCMVCETPATGGDGDIKCEGEVKKEAQDCVDNKSKCKADIIDTLEFACDW